MRDLHENVAEWLRDFKMGDDLTPWEECSQATKNHWYLAKEQLFALLSQHGVVRLAEDQNVPTETSYQPRFRRARRLSREDMWEAGFHRVIGLEEK